jgi:hypothetical protein
MIPDRNGWAATPAYQMGKLDFPIFCIDQDNLTTED